ncbi:MAG: hypothetical protein K2X98_02910 [Alphaproteobacteria bacterium]|nr:hypothetical protein [Alphaproteobacteria bacterium]
MKHFYSFTMKGAQSASKIFRILFLLPFLFCGQVIGKGYIERTLDHISNHKVLYATGVVVLTAAYFIPTAEAVPFQTHPLSINRCPPCIPMDFEVTKSSAPHCYFQPPQWGQGYCGPYVEAVTAIADNIVYMGKELSTFLINQMRRCEFVCPDIPLIPEMSKNNAINGFFNCAYNMTKPFMMDTPAYLYTKISEETRQCWWRSMVFSTLS